MVQEMSAGLLLFVLCVLPAQAADSVLEELRQAAGDAVAASDTPEISGAPSHPPIVVSGAELERLYTQVLDENDIAPSLRANYPYAGAIRDLLSYGAKPEQLGVFYERHLQEVARGFSQGRFPASLIKEIGKSHMGYSARAAGAIRTGRQPAQLRADLAAKLGSRSHIYRTGTDYNESTSTLAGVQDGIILALLTRYADFFANPANWAPIVALFPPHEYPRPERGGLMMYKNNAVKFLPIKQEQMANGRALEAYRPPKVYYYAPALGMLHTHPAEKGTPSAEISGPSGETRHRGDMFDPNGGDFGALRYASWSNPFFIDVVVTELGGDRYNVDAYFRDVRKSSSGKAERVRGVKVIDLGVFTATP
jgi:hypothetical protein